MIDVDQRIQAAETRIFKAVFPSTTNNHDTLFGGTAMQLMDETVRRCGGIRCRYALHPKTSYNCFFRQNKFHQPIPAGTIAGLRILAIPASG